jgi:hypothetical protein
MSGFRPVQDISGSDYTGKVQTYGVASGHATLLAVGDLVTVTGTADATTGQALVDASSAGTGNPITGVIVAIDKNISNLEQKGLPAGTAGFVKVAVDPNLLLEAEISGGAIAVTDVENNAPVVVTAATSSGGLVQSNMTVDATGFVATTEQVRIIGIKDTSDLAAGATVLCRINESTIKEVVGV